MLPGERVERYELLGELATGGMATVYVGRQHGPFGFSRTVAIKSMHPQFAKDDGFRAMFLDEATLTSKIRHPNVVPTLDIVSTEAQLLLVMEYVEGASLSSIMRAANIKKATVPVPVAVAILCDVLQGLHAAHELADDEGRPLAVVHRDVSPQNVHVGVDGLARVLDFGVAKAASRRYVTQTGEIKGKLAYMAREQLSGEEVDRRTDIYAAGVVLWEVLAGRRLIEGTNEGAIVTKVLDGTFLTPSLVAEQPIPEGLDRVVMKALARSPDHRWATAEEMARAVAEAVGPAPRATVSAFVKELIGSSLDARAERLREAKTPHLAPEAKVVRDVLTNYVATTTQPPATAPRRRRLFTIVGSVFVLVALTGGAFYVGLRSARPTPPPPSAPAALEPSALAPSSPPPPSVVESAAPPPPAIVSTWPSSSSAKRPPRPPLHATASATAPLRPDCRVPYTVDAHGDRHYKAECVE